jgi:hypothetical protein
MPSLKRCVILLYKSLYSAWLVYISLQCCLTVVMRIVRLPRAKLQYSHKKLLQIKVARSECSVCEALLLVVLVSFSAAHAAHIPTAVLLLQSLLLNNNNNNNTTNR